MGVVNRIKEMFSPSEYTDEMYEENENEELFGDNIGSNETPIDRPVSAPKSVSYGSSLELKVVRPDGFENVTAIADHLLAKRTVVLNLEDTNKESARRLLDFLSGVAYAIDGSLKRVTSTTFIITPNNVNVSGEQLQDIADDAEAEEQNQLF